MKSQPITILAITFLIIAAICFFVLRPVVSTIWSSWKSLEKARLDIQNLDQEIQALEALKNNPDLQNVNDIALKYIPQEADSGELVVELSAIANTNNFQVEQVSMENQKTSTSSSSEEVATPTPKNNATPQATATPKKTANAAEVNFSLKATGNFSDLTNFLRGMETSSRLITVKSLNLQMEQSGTQDNNQNTLSVSMVGTAYYKSDVSIADNLKNIQVSPETISKFLNLTTYGSPINLPAESGFGRTNPFENY